jgi:hypothetical protein
MEGVEGVETIISMVQRMMTILKVEQIMMS